MGTLPPWGIEVRRTKWAGEGCMATGDILGGREADGGPGVTLVVENGGESLGSAGAGAGAVAGGDDDDVDDMSGGCGAVWG